MAIKILTIIGDSLALPRPEDGLLLRDTYPYLLQEAFHSNLYVINKARPSNDSQLQADTPGISGDILPAQSDFFALQLGIVDCSPRLFTPFQRAILEVLLKTKYARRTTDFMARRGAKRLELTKSKSIVQVPLHQFRNNVERILSAIVNHNPVRAIFLINIARPSRAMQDRSFGLLDNVNLYNEALAEMAKESGGLVRVIDLFSYTDARPESILGDGYHISRVGHEFVAQEITPYLRSQQLVE